MKSIVVVSLVLVAFAFADPPWTDNVLAADVGDTINEGESCMAMDGDYIYCICNVNERNRIAVIPYGRSTDGGQTWTTTWWKDMTVGIRWHTDPVLLCDDTGYVHMFIQYSSTIIRHYLSTDHGLTWCDSTDVSDRSSVDKPWACYHGNNIYICWQAFAGSYSGIAFAKSTDCGRSWTRSTIDPYRTGITGICTSPSGDIYVMNRYWSGGSIYIIKSTDEGNTWTTPLLIETGCQYTDGYGDRCPLPCIAAPTDSHIFVTWVDDRYGNWDILYKRSTDAGATWTSTAILNDSVTGGQCKGWVSCDPFGGLHIIWYHTPSWPTSQYSWWSIRYQYSNDYGATIRPSIRLSDTTFRSPVTFMGEYHVILADSEKVRCIWTDGRETDLDLWFAEADLSAIGVEENPFRTVRVATVWLNVPTVIRGRTVPVEFGLRKGSLVRVKVFDALGRNLKSANLGYREPGLHRIQVSDLPAGQTLFVKLEAGETVTRKCTVLR